VNAALSAARARLDVEHERALAERDAQLQSLSEHPTDLIVVLKAERDSSGTIVDWIYARANRNAAAILNLPLERIVGRRLSEVAPERAAKASEQCKLVIGQGETVRCESQFADRHLVVTMFAAGADHVVSSGQDVTEQRRLQAALQDTDRRKDEFLAMLAHELRNPVAPIANAAERCRGSYSTRASGRSSASCNDSPRIWHACWMTCWTWPGSPRAASSCSVR
jgi:signal transduction histidine kinase